jgi:hypothetical protein
MTSPYSEQARQNFLRLYYALESVSSETVEAQLPQSLVPHSADWLQALDEHYEVIQEVMRITLHQTNPQQREILLNELLQRVEKSNHGQNNGLTSEVLKDIYLPAIEDYTERIRKARAEGDRYFETYLSAQADFVRPAQTYKENAAAAYVAERFPFATPYGIGVRMGEYAVVRSNDPEIPDFIATDYLLDCQALVLTGQAEGQPRITVISHIDAVTHPNTAVAELLAEFPPGYRVEAGIFSSGQSLNPAISGMLVNSYLAIDLIEALRQSGRVDQVSHQLNSASTVAVDIRTGSILTTNTPENQQTGYRITDELPINIAFASDVRQHEQEHITEQSDRLLLWKRIRNASETEPFQPTGRLVRTFSSHESPLAEPSLRRDLAQAAEDGAITHDELSQVVRRIGNVLSREGLCYRLEEQGSDLMMEIRDSSKHIASHTLPLEISPHAGTGNCSNLR